METQPTTKEIPWERSLRYDVVVFGMVILTLIAGWIMRLLVEGERTKFSDPEIQLSIQYPASWTTQKEKGHLLSVRNLRAEGTFKVGFWLEVKDYPAEAIKQVQELLRHSALREVGSSLVIGF